MAMINPDQGTDIKAIMKISAQLLGPKDEHNTLTMDLSDEHDPNVELILPAELNPKVYQWAIKI